MDIQQYLSFEFYRNLIRSVSGGRIGRQVIIGVSGVLGAIVVASGAYFAYDKVTAIAPPDVKEAKPEEIGDFMGHPRGFARLPVPKRGEFLGGLAAAHTKPEKREKLAKAFRRMTSEEKKVCWDAIWDVGYDAVNKEVDAFRKLPPEERAAFIDKRIAAYNRGRIYVAGNSRAAQYSPPLFDESWLEGMPTNSDGMVKMIIAKTRPKDRVRMKPFVEALTSRVDELDKNPREKQRFLARHAVDETAGG